MNIEKENRTTQINMWLKEEEKEINEAEEVQKEIEVRLSTVLRLNQISNENEKAEVAEELVPLANKIREFVWRMKHVTCSYKNMLGRIELP